MSRFILIAMSVIGAAHFYVWARLVHAPRWPEPAYSLLSLLALLLWLSIPVTFVQARRAPPRTALFVAWLGYAWLGSIFLFLVSVLAADLLRAVLGVVSLATGAAFFGDLTELELARRFAAGTALVAAGALVSSLVLGRRVVVKRVEVPLARLPQSLSGMSIVQLSDVHIGPTLGRRFLERVVAAVNRLSPDVIVITGDLVDGSVERLAHAAAPLAELSARHGVYFVTGNHEYYSGADAWCAHLSQLGVRVLRNERVSIGEGEDSFDLAGIDDFTAHHFGPGHGADLKRALEGRDPSRALVLLAHQPRAVHEAERAGVSLQLSGHTHGGQIWPFNYLVRLQQPVTAGLERFGRALIYVSSGTGYWGPPMRLGSSAEISQLVLLARAEAQSVPASRPDSPLAA